MPSYCDITPAQLITHGLLKWAMNKIVDWLSRNQYWFLFAYKFCKLNNELMSVIVLIYIQITKNLHFQPNFSVGTPFFKNCWIPGPNFFILKLGNHLFTTVIFQSGSIFQKLFEFQTPFFNSQLEPWINIRMFSMQFLWGIINVTSRLVDYRM